MRQAVAIDNTIKGVAIKRALTLLQKLFALVAVTPFKVVAVLPLNLWRIAVEFVAYCR